MKNVKKDLFPKLSLFRKSTETKTAKRLVCTALLAVMTITAAIPVFADSTDIYVSLGADLTQSQRATVLQLMNLTEDDLKNIEVTTITNQMEKETLGQYLPASVIGSRALSCTKVEKTKSGGISVKTHNISYCTEGMYQNALITAGVENANVTVAGPTSISGTAGLVGAMKAYQDLTGDELTDAQQDAAVNELVTTGDLANQLGSSEDAENLVALVKQKVASENLSSEEDIRRAIQDGSQELGITLSDSEVQMILDLMKKISKLDLNADQLQRQAMNIYNRLQNLGIDMSAYDKDTIINSISSFLKKIIEFCKGLFG